jgi:hypothetical protein
MINLNMKSMTSPNQARLDVDWGLIRASMYIIHCDEAD